MEIRCPKCNEYIGTMAPGTIVSPQILEELQKDLKRLLVTMEVNKE